MNSVGGNALHNTRYIIIIMRLSISCLTPGGGGGDTGDLTNRGVKFPTTGEKSAVKSPTP